jgi:hypothetical protein
MTLRTTTAAVAAALALAACGDATQPGPVDITGTWSLDATDVQSPYSGVGLVCSVVGATITFTAHGAGGWQGRYEPGTVWCRSNLQPPNQQPPVPSAMDLAQVRGDSVLFGLEAGAVNAGFRGRIHGGEIQGTAGARGEQLEPAGTFVMRRR